MTRRYDQVKRVLDAAGAGLLLTLAAPVIAVAAAGVLITMGPPVLFRQCRPGRDEVPFTLVKLRSMHRTQQGRRAGRGAYSSDEAHDPADDPVRLTRYGQFLRATSVDELPSLWNVVRGDMSMVGPRPLLMEYLSLYNAHQARRHEVRPGITGLAQVRGRNGLDWADQLALDVHYVDRRSPWLDLAILRSTVGVVLTRRGVHAPGQATRAAFRGGAPMSGGSDE